MLFLSKNVFFSRQSAPPTPAPVTPFSLDYLVIAGGGGGGGAWTNNNFGSGGGGAGGYLAGSATLSNLLTFNVIVGAGGGLANVFNFLGLSGSDSVFDSSFLSVVSTGGGGGGRNGGSGGGNFANEPFGLGISGQGFNGAKGPLDGHSGAGGGAGEAGGSGATTAKGGDGLTWLDGIIRAGGGGGTRWNQAVNGALSGPGGAGGGGRGANTDVDPDVFATAGTINTGSGGGVGWPTSGYSDGQPGGSGIVKVRYTGTPRATGGTITQSGGFTYHEFTSSGILTFTS